MVAESGMATGSVELVVAVLSFEAVSPSVFSLLHEKIKTDAAQAVSKMRFIIVGLSLDGKYKFFL
jgi:hypothetical protein